MSGPPPSFAAALEAHGAALRRLAGGYATDGDDADDLYQEILIALWRALPAFRGECALRTFVLRVGHNRAVTHVRRRRPGGGADAGAVADGAPGPDERADAALAAEGLRAAVRRLTPGLREVVMLQLEGLPVSEIADVLGVSANAVSVRLHRARAALRRELGQEEHP